MKQIPKCQSQSHTPIASSLSNKKNKKKATKLSFKTALPLRALFSLQKTSKSKPESRVLFNRGVSIAKWASRCLIAKNQTSTITATLTLRQRSARSITERRTWQARAVWRLSCEVSLASRQGTWGGIIRNSDDLLSLIYKWWVIDEMDNGIFGHIRISWVCVFSCIALSLAKTVRNHSAEVTVDQRRCNLRWIVKIDDGFPLNKIIVEIEVRNTLEKPFLWATIRKVAYPSGRQRKLAFNFQSLYL